MVRVLTNQILLIGEYHYSKNITIKNDLVVISSKIDINKD
jgi:hypothetical protein